MTNPSEEQKMNEDTKTRITAVRTVGVPVTDQDRALDFYVDGLGLEKRMDSPVPQVGGRWIEVAPAGSETTLALVPRATAFQRALRPGSGLRPTTRKTITRACFPPVSTWASCCAGRAFRPCSRSAIPTATASRSSRARNDRTARRGDLA